MPNFKEKTTLQDIAEKVDDLVGGKVEGLDGEKVMQRFREMVEEYGKINDKYEKKNSKAADERNKNVKNLKKNKHLQNKKSVPPDDTYTWCEDIGYFNQKTNKIEKLSGWMPTSTVQVPEDPAVWKNYGKHKDISSLTPETLLLNQYFLLAVCHDCMMGVERRPLIITKKMAEKYDDGLGLYYTGHGHTKYVQPILEGKYEGFLEFAYDDILHDLQAIFEQGTQVEKEKPKNKRGRPSDTNKKEDKNIFQAWETGQYENYEQLANEFHKTKYEIERIIDRHRKRLKREEGKQG